RYTNWFPSVHGIYNFSQDLILRSSVTTGIARADFEKLAPFIDEDPVSRTASTGNPDLKPTRAVNYDLMLEYYIRPLGLFSAGAFYKDVSDFIFIANSNPTEGALAGYRVSRPENASSGDIRGFEISYQQPLTFLPDPFDGLGLMFNYTWTDSAITLNDGRKVRMPGQSRHSSNFSIYYEKFGFKVRLAYSHRSSYIDSIDSRGPQFDMYWGGRQQVDITASYDITSSLQIFTEFQNITNSRGKRYFGDASRVYELEEFGWWMNLGLRFNF
ncbi:MAG: TonB-dependent receptor, partial [Verrucomicrobia bacterium]|nr:TonB-dependent receptor [Verrucomicrobiota bacterium]